MWINTMNQHRIFLKCNPWAVWSVENEVYLCFPFPAFDSIWHAASREQTGRIILWFSFSIQTGLMSLLCMSLMLLYLGIVVKKWWVGVGKEKSRKLAIKIKVLSFSITSWTLGWGCYCCLNLQLLENICVTVSWFD